MKKKQWIGMLLAFAMICLCISAFGESAEDGERTMHSVSIDELVEMLYAPEKAALVGETISVNGNFGGLYNEGTADAYCFLALAKRSACSSESIRFIPDASCTDFPAPGTPVTLTGTLIRTETNGAFALRIVDATMVWEGSMDIALTIGGEP